jgi:hypothetical protein
MTLPILAATAKEADPRRNYRMRDFLETLGLRAVFVPDPEPVAAIEAGPAPEAEAPAASAPPAPGGGPYCEAPGPHYTCTASPEHLGDHIAYGSDGEVCDRWPQESPAQVPQCDCQEDPPGAEGEASAAPEVPEGESGSEEEAVPVAGQPALEPYTLSSISVPAKDEPAEAEAAPDAEPQS